MIRQNTRNAVAPVLRNLVKRNLSLEAVDGTVLSTMVESATVVEPEAVVATLPVAEGETVSETAVVDGILDATVEQAATSPVHSGITDELIARGAAVFGEAIAKTQSIVVPAIGRLIDTVTHRLSVKLVPPHEVRAISIPALMVNQQIVGMFENYAAAPEQTLKAIDGLPALDEQALLTYTETGSTELNGIIADTIASHPDGWLVYVYDSLLRNNVADNGAFLSLTYYDTHRRVRNTLDTMDAVVLAAIIAQNIGLNPPEGISMPPEQLESIVTDFKICMARAWAVVANEITRMAQNQLVVMSPWVLSEQPTMTDIVVLREQYEKALEAGLTPEALKGAKVSGETLSILGLPTLLARKDAFVQEWQQYQTEYESRGNREASAALSELTIEEFRRILDEHPVVAEGYDIDTVMAKAKAYLNNYAITRENMYDVAVKLIADFAYGCYKSNHIIYHMDRVLDDNPTMQPRTAAYLATVDMVTDWAVKQLK